MLHSLPSLLATARSLPTIRAYRLLQEPAIQRRLEELEEEYSTDVDVVSELEKQYEQAKANGNGQTALKALELLSRVRGNNAEDEGPQDVAGLEGKICASMKIIGKEKMYELFMSTWPEDFEEEEDEATPDE